MSRGLQKLTSDSSSAISHRTPPGIPQKKPPDVLSKLFTGVSSEIFPDMYIKKFPEISSKNPQQITQVIPPFKNLSKITPGIRLENHPGIPSVIHQEIPLEILFI